MTNIVVKNKCYEKEIKTKPNIAVVFLVPISDESLPHPNIEMEFNELIINKEDAPNFKTLLTWQRNNLDETPSIMQIIEEILIEESKGIIEPLPEYTRHTLKAFNMFIASDFSGYDYEKGSTASSSDNPLTEKRYSISQLQKENKGYVGVAKGVSGLIRMDEQSIINSFK